MKLFDNIGLLFGSRECKSLDYVLLYSSDRNLAATVATTRRIRRRMRLSAQDLLKNIVIDAHRMGLIDDAERDSHIDYIENLWEPVLIIYSLTHEKTIRL